MGFQSLLVSFESILIQLREPTAFFCYLLVGPELLWLDCFRVSEGSVRSVGQLLKLRTLKNLSGRRLGLIKV